MADEAGALKERGTRATERAYHDSKGMLQKLQEHSPNSRQVLGFITLVASVITLFVVGGFALGGLAITLMVATPFLILASPILIPLGFFLFVVVSGFLAFAGFVGASLFIASWLYKYMKGRHPVGSDQIDAARRSLAETVSRAKDKAQNYTGYVQARAQEAAPGA